MILRFLGQSGFELTSGSSHILIDPYFSDIVGKLQGRPRLLPIPKYQQQYDGIFCTHNHLDHLDPETVVLFPKEQKFITTADGVQALQKLGMNNASMIADGQSIVCGDFSVTAVPAFHSAEAVGLIVKAEGITLYFSGDTLYDERLFAISGYAPDITFICINGRLGNMNTQEALQVAAAIGAPVNIPHHYDMFASNSADPYAFADHIPGGKVLAFDTPYEVHELLR